MKPLGNRLREMSRLLFHRLPKVAQKIISNLYHRFMRSNQIRELRNGSDFKIEILYQKDYSSTLAALCDLHGTDKGEVSPGNNPYPWESHSYSDFYASLFSHCRRGVTAVFECGIGTTDLETPSNMSQNGVPGASLRVWRDYFPNAEIVGADIDSSVLFEESRIFTYRVNQLDSISISKLWEQVAVESFDLMIDDGLHTYLGGITLFQNSIHKLARDGIYVIEDVAPSDLLRFKEYFQSTEYQVNFVSCRKANATLWGSSLVVVRKPESMTLL